MSDKKHTQDQDEDSNGTTEEMVKWYKTTTKSHLDRILSVFEQQQKVMSEIIVPLYNNGHFLILHITLPSQERNNGGVFIYNYLGKGEDESSLIAKMWANFLGSSIRNNLYSKIIFTWAFKT